MSRICTAFCAAECEYSKCRFHKKYAKRVKEPKFINLKDTVYCNKIIKKRR